MAISTDAVIRETREGGGEKRRFLLFLYSRMARAGPCEKYRPATTSAEWELPGLRKMSTPIPTRSLNAHAIKMIGVQGAGEEEWRPRQLSPTS